MKNATATDSFLSPARIDASNEFRAAHGLAPKGATVRLAETNALRARHGLAPVAVAAPVALEAGPVPMTAADVAALKIGDMVKVIASGKTYTVHPVWGAGQFQLVKDGKRFGRARALVPASITRI